MPEVSDLTSGRRGRVSIRVHSAKDAARLCKTLHPALFFKLIVLGAFLAFATGGSPAMDGIGGVAKTADLRTRLARVARHARECRATIDDG